MEEKRIVALIGMKHCGKSSCGRILAQRLNVPFADTDALIESGTGKTARELFLEGGASLMAEAESAACAKALEMAAGRGGVISTGGAFCENASAVALLRGGCVFCLIEAGLDVLYGRILKSAKEEGEMPAFLRGDSPKERFSSIYKERMEKYRQMADIAVKSGGDARPEVVADAALQKLKALCPGIASLAGRELGAP